MRAMITGGGTGGHIYPALAIAEGIRNKYPDAELLYVGSDSGLEKELATRNGYEFHGISVAGLPRPISARTVQVLFRNAKGVREAGRLLRDFRPDLVVGTGGYACGPLMLAAAKKGYPTLLHEQNAVMGVTNNILSKHVRRICLTFPIADPNFRFQDKAVLTGLPVRAKILQADKQAGLAHFGFTADRPVLLVTGGSQGARHLNQALAGNWQKVLDSGCQLIHLTGPKLFAEMEAEARKLNLLGRADFKLEPYLHEMDLALAAADVVASRAGASFLAEVMAIGLPCVLIPYPFAAGNHQEANAKALVDANAAKMILDKNLNFTSLWKALEPMLTDAELRAVMTDNCRRLGKRHAVDDIITEAELIMK